MHKKKRNLNFYNAIIKYIYNKINVIINLSIWNAIMLYFGLPVLIVTL